MLGSPQLLSMRHTKQLQASYRGPLQLLPHFLQFHPTLPQKMVLHARVLSCKRFYSLQQEGIRLLGHVRCHTRAPVSNGARVYIVVARARVRRRLQLRCQLETHSIGGRVLVWPAGVICRAGAWQRIERLGLIPAGAQLCWNSASKESGHKNTTGSMRQRYSYGNQLEELQCGIQQELQRTGASWSP